MSQDIFKCFVLNALYSKAKQLRIVLRHGIRPDFCEIHLLSECDAYILTKYIRWSVIHKYNHNYMIFSGRLLVGPYRLSPCLTRFPLCGVLWRELRALNRESLYFTCNESRFFPVGIDLQGVPCKLYRVWVYSAAPQFCQCAPLNFLLSLDVIKLNGQDTTRLYFYCFTCK